MRTVLNIALALSFIFCAACACSYWWLFLIRKRKPDRSFWMICSKCIVKWRPGAYGPPAPDDFYCPVCNETGDVHPGMDPHRKIARFTEGCKIPK